MNNEIQVHTITQIPFDGYDNESHLNKTVRYHDSERDDDDEDENKFITVKGHTRTLHENGYWDYTREIPVKEHTRRIKTTEHRGKQPRVQPGKKKQPSEELKRQSYMDVASFKTILQKHKEDMAFYKEKNPSNKKTLEQKEAWENLWEIGKKASAKKRKKPKFVWKAKYDKAVKSRKKYFDRLSDLSKPMTAKIHECYVPLPTYEGKRPSVRNCR